MPFILVLHALQGFLKYDQSGLYFNSNSIQKNKSVISKMESLKDLGCVMKNSPGITMELVICGK